jgi:hypothetical protein
MKENAIEVEKLSDLFANANEIIKSFNERE